MNEKRLEYKNTPSVIAHIEMLQGIIGRMAGNSAACKTWTVAIISAILVLIWEGGCIDKNKLGIIYIPTALFFILDCYYLGIERQIIKVQNAFVQKLNYADEISNDLFVINLTKGFWANLKETIKAIKSFSTLPFYGIIFFIIYCMTHL